jgi:hypothetical protein
MDTWEAEPYWKFWDDQLALIAQANAPAPDPQLKAAVTEITQLLRGDALPARAQRLGELRHGAKHWKRRR